MKTVFFFLVLHLSGHVLIKKTKKNNPLNIYVTRLEKSNPVGKQQKSSPFCCFEHYIWASSDFDTSNKVKEFFNI